MSDGPPLRLVAVDPTDLSVIAACLQDALVPVSDIAALPDEKRFAVALNRFMWERGESQDKDGPLYYRTHALLRIDNVSAIRSRGYDRDDRARILSLMSVRPGEDSVDLIFAEGAAIRILAAPLRATLVDMGEPWPTRWRPGHE